MHSTSAVEPPRELKDGDLEPIAIVGMAGRFPKARNVREFWARLYSAEDCISRLTSSDLEAHGIDPAICVDPNYVPAAPVLDDVEQFDAAFFGITPREAELMDPQQRIFLECCWEALEDAGYDPKNCGHAMGLFAGERTDTYLFNILTHSDLVRGVGAFHLGLGNDLAFLTTRVSHLLNLTGPAVSVHTACSTSLVAVHLACEALRHQQCDAALAGGVAVNVPHYVGYIYEEGSVQSPDGYCRSFDASARGTVFGSGAGVVLLKRLGDAIKNCDSIYAVIRGSAVNNDGSDKASFTAPSVRGQVNVIREALRVSQVHPDTIGYVECHGTGTLLGDAIEVRALVKAFGKGVPRSCAIGSVKTNVGHLDAAAGMTGLIKTALSLKHQTIPASLHYVRPNPQIDFEGSRFYVNTSTSSWLTQSNPRRAGVSAFGVGGTNAHVILEEAPSQYLPNEESEVHVLPLSARSETALAHACKSLANHLREASSQSQIRLSDVAFTLQQGRHSFSSRRAIMASSIDEAIAGLNEATSSPEAVQSVPDIPPAVTFLFPGQGAQYAGMGREFYEKEPVYRAQVTECSDIVSPLLGQNLLSILYGPPSSLSSQSAHDLTDTWLAQPALLAVEYSLARLWMSWGVQPESMFGHSLGEYTAATLAGVMSIEDALRLVAIRGKLMQQTTPGAMLAVSRSGTEILPQLNDGLEMAAFNASDLCTVTGTPEAILSLEARLKAQSIACQILRTSHAFHSSLMEPAMEPFLEELSRIHLNAPKIPFISCVTGTWIRPEEAQQPEYWVRQMRLPVQFDKGLTEFLNGDDRILVDIGPAQTLRRIAVRKARSNDFCEVLGAMPSSLSANERRNALTTLARLWESGVSVSWPALREGKVQRVSLPTYPFERRRFWIDPSLSATVLSEDHGKPAESRTGQEKADVSQWFWVPSPRLAPSVLERRAPRGTWLIYCDPTGVGDQVCMELLAIGEKFVRVSAGVEFRRIGETNYEIDPLRREHHMALWESLANSDVDISTVISLTGLVHRNRRTEASLKSTDPYDRETVDSNLFGIQAMLSRSDDLGCRYVIVSNRLLDVEWNDRIEPSRAGILGFARTLNAEYEQYECRVIDVGMVEDGSPLTETARQIVEEARSSADEDLVAYRGTRRWIRGFEQLRIPAAYQRQPAGPENHVYLILGGLGSVGIQIAEYLSKDTQAKLVLAGRTALPERTTWKEILETEPEGARSHRIRAVLTLEEAGAEVETIAVDITDDEQLANAISYVEGRFGNVPAIIHSVGVTSGPSVFRPWMQLQPEDFSIQANAKVRGLETLARVIDGKQVPFVLLISSNSSIVGGLGFAAYASGSCSMNAFAEQVSKERGTRWLSVSWDHWPEPRAATISSDVGQLYGELTEGAITHALELKYRYAVTAYDVEAGLSAVFSVPNSGHLILSTGDLRERLYPTRTQRPHVRGSISSAQSKSPRPHLKNIYRPPASQIELAIAAIWEEYLGIQLVGVNDDFFELGGHSLMATKVVASIRDHFQTHIPLAKLFEGPTVAQMAALISSAQDDLDLDAAHQETASSEAV